MSIREFLQWEAYYSLEPFGQERDNWHMATLASVFANAFSKKQFSSDDFMLKDAQEIKKKETNNVITQLFAIAKEKTNG
jgi:hypothetical protein